MVFPPPSESGAVHCQMGTYVPLVWLNGWEFLGDFGKGLDALGHIRNRARKVVAANSVGKK